jgi:hypothetical protein
MKQGPTIADVIERIRGLSASMGGVFSYGDLFNAIASGSAIKNKRMIKRLTREGVLFKVQRGYYVTKKPDLPSLACRLKPSVYVSMDSALAMNGIIGTVPEGTVSAVGPEIRKRTVEIPWGTIRFFSIKKYLIFGVSSLPNGVRIADNEKAYLDMLYFHAKGARFAIDPIHEVNVRKLNHKKLKKYLSFYRNPKFVRFVKGLADENT